MAQVSITTHSNKSMNFDSTTPNNSENFRTELLPGIDSGKIIQKRYQLEGVIGRGGIGEVYLAMDMKKNSEVAVKICRNAPQKKCCEKRVKRETRELQKINHINHVKLKNSGIVDGDPFLVMEYMKGMDLKKYLDIYKILPWESTKLIMIQLCDAVQALHEKGIIHQDIKPENIFISDQGLVKLFDFDVSEFIFLERLWGKGKFYGTPMYLAPETCKEKMPDHRIDIWASGVVMYQMLCGDTPFNANNFYALIYRIVMDEPLWPGEVDPKASIPKEAENIVMHALEKNPDKRFQSMKEMKNAILQVKVQCQVQNIEQNKISFASSVFESIKQKTFEFLDTISFIPDFVDTARQSAGSASF